MQQHTGQHLLTAVMNTYDNLETLGWGMGADGGINYIDVPRKPSPEEVQSIQARCNQIIRENLSITVNTPVVQATDVDQEKGLVRVVSIGNLDRNAQVFDNRNQGDVLTLLRCCGTHLSQTSHISLILLHHTQPIHSTNYRLFFSVGDRAIKASTESITALRLIAKMISSPSDPSDVVANVQRVSDSATDLKRHERKLLSEIATYEGDRVKALLQAGGNAWVYRPSGNLEFLNMVVAEVKDVAKEHGVVVLAAGDGQAGGPIVVIGEKDAVSEMVGKVQGVMETVKGGGKREKWQGKVSEWRKGDIEALKGLVE